MNYTCSVLCLASLGLLTACATDDGGAPQEEANNTGYTFANARYAEGDTSLVDLCGQFEIGTHPLAGTYVGFWKDGAADVLQTAIIVDSVGDDGATEILYSHGHYTPWRVDYSECERFSARFSDDDTLLVDFRGGHKGTFEFIDADQVSGKYTSSTGDTRGSFSRI